MSKPGCARSATPSPARGRGGRGWGILRRSFFEDRLDDLPARRLARGDPLGLDTLGLPEDLGDPLDASQQILGGLGIHLLLDRRAQLAGLPDQLVQLRELLGMLWSEIIRPED